jgi:predicted Zn finger-like uncharacterized protein
MNAHTTCPRCSSVFRITPVQLDAAQGWAQCSVCGGRFDARATLTDEHGAAWPVPAPTPAPVPIITAHEWVSAESAPQLHGISQRESRAELDSIILIDPDADAPDEFGPLPVFAPAPVTPPPAAVAKAQVYRPAIAAASAAPHKPVRNKPLADATPAAPVRRRHSKSGLLVAAVLLAALAAQLAYFMRDTLASALPETRPWFVQACASLGCRVSLPHNASLIQIVGSDLQAAGGKQYNLKLTLGNRAEHAQAWPVIVLTLTDDNDQPQARRSFAPSEYLADHAKQDAGITARSETPLTLPLSVGVKLAGYHVEVSY